MTTQEFRCAAPGDVSSSDKRSVALGSNLRLTTAAAIHYTMCLLRAADRRSRTSKDDPSDMGPYGPQKTRGPAGGPISSFEKLHTSLGFACENLVEKASEPFCACNGRSTSWLPMWLLRHLRASMCLLRWFHDVPANISHKLTCIYIYIHIHIYIYIYI